MTATVRRATPDDADQIAEIIGEIILEDNPVGFDREWSDDEVVGFCYNQYMGKLMCYPLRERFGVATLSVQLRRCP